MTDKISPFPEYPGHITLPTELTWPQYLAFGDLSNAAVGSADPRFCMSSIEALSTIMEWHIDNLPQKPTAPDIFVGHNGFLAGQFYAWVYAQVRKVYAHETEIPNAPAPESIDSAKTPAIIPDPAS